MFRPHSQLWNTCLGNLFEHYDTALFGFLSPFLAHLIFPEYDPMMALILTYVMMGFGMLARPMGALVFGFIGDCYGRGQALSLTLGGMAFVSSCIAFTPTYIQVGVLAPIIFGLGRVLQNFLAAGETIGGGVFVLEHSPEKQHDMLSSFYGASSIGGLLLASFGVLILSQYDMVDPGWRFLYLFGGITALFGYFIRRSSLTTMESVKKQKTNLSLKSALWMHKKPLLLIITVSGFTHATYTMALVLMNGFIPFISPLTKAKLLEINTYLLVLDFLALPLFGWIASKIGREKLMLGSSLATCILSIPLCLSLNEASLTWVIGIRTFFVLLGVAFCAPFHAWAQQIVPSQCRYAVISFGYAVGSQVLGGPTAALSLWLFQKTGMISSIAWYWVVLAAAAGISVAISKGMNSCEIFEERAEYLQKN